MLPNSSVSCEDSDLFPKPLARTDDLRQRDERLQAMKALVGQLAHSFNNSLAPLAGYLTLLWDEIDPGTPGEQYLRKVEGSMHKSEGYITTILQATHPEREFMPKPTDLTSLLQRITEAWMKSLPATAQISVEWDVAPCTLWLDENQWTRLIGHLLRNAEAALAQGGTLRLGLRKMKLSAEGAADLGLHETAVIQLTFEDTGTGMSPDVLQRACEPLFTTGAHAPAAGLGLTLVHSVVQLHGGQVRLESREELGTTVRIWLPDSEA